MTGQPSANDNGAPAAAVEPSADGMSGDAVVTWRHLVAARVRDRAQAVRELAAYRWRWDLTREDVNAILNRYPVMAWDSPTTDIYLHLVGGITPGGLPAVLAAVPDQHWVCADAPTEVAEIGAAHRTLDDLASREHDCDGSCVGTALLILTAQGFITDQDPAAAPSATVSEPGPTSVRGQEFGSLADP